MRPSKYAFTSRLALLELALIYVAVLKSFITASVPLVIAPISFINSSIIVNDDSFALPQPVLKFSFEYGIFILLDAELILSLDGIIVKFIALHLIVY